MENSSILSIVNGNQVFSLAMCPAVIVKLQSVSASS